MSKKAKEQELAITPEEEIAFVCKAIRLTEPIEGLGNKISLSLGAKKVRDYCLALIDPATLTAILDLDQYLDDMGVSKTNRSAYYANVEKNLLELKSSVVMINVPQETNPDYSIAVAVSWLDKLIRVDKKDTKYGRKYAVHFDPVIRPNIIDLRENFYRFSQTLPIHLKSDYSYDLYQFLIAREYLPQPITVELDYLFSYLGTSLNNFTKKSTALQTVIRDASKEINGKSDISVSYAFGKKPITTVTFYITRKYGICGSMGKLSEPAELPQDENTRLDQLKKQISYDKLVSMVANEEIQCHASHLDVILSCMYEVLFEPRGPYKINGTSAFPLQTLQGAYRTICIEEVIYALEAVYKRNQPLEYPVAFYRTTLFNAALQGQAYTDSKKANQKQNASPVPKREFDEDELAAIARFMAEEL